MKSLTTITLLLFLTLAHAQTTYYVDVSRPDNSGDGLTWATAKKDLQNALNLVVDGDEVRVASGTYHPNSAPGTTLTKSTEFYFWINTNIKLRGSYNPSTDTQDFSNPSILSGDLGTANTVHVLITTNLNNTALIEGFTITRGAAVHKTGSVTIGGQLIEYNCGGGMYNAFSSPSLVNVTFLANRALQSGGGMYNRNSSPNMVNIFFSENNTGNNGGGIANISSSPSLTNVVFYKNNASHTGGGAYNSSYSSYTNVIFYKNSANQGCGMNNSGNSMPLLANTLFYGNTANANSNYVYISTDVSGNLDPSSNNNASDYTGHEGTSIKRGTVVLLPASPFFYEDNPEGSDGVFGTADDGLRLKAISPAVNAGNNAFLPADVIDLDKDGNTIEAIPYDITRDNRIQNTTVNIGAYENVVSCTDPTATRLYVNASVSGGNNDGSSWTDAYSNLLEAIGKANICTNITEIWIAKGVYKTFNETSTFTIPKNISLFGGFLGTENNRSDRNWATNPTILSGDINDNGIADAGDAHTIVRTINNNSTLDGFIIENSYADGTASSPIAIGRAGGGIYNNGTDNTINHCIFRNNVAQGDGANGIGGAIVSFSTGTLNIYNSLFYNNNASANGGALSIENGTTKLINCTIANNTANRGGGAHFYGGNLEATNSIFYQNTGTNGNINDDNPMGGGTGRVAYCYFYNTTSGNNGEIPPKIINGGSNIAATTGSGNAGTDPLFTNTSNNDFNLQSGSLAIDAGENTANSSTKDLGGNNRLSHAAIDIGTYEYQSTLSSPHNQNQLI